MKPWKKIAIGGGVVIVLAAIIGITVYQSGKNVVTVQTGAQNVRQHRRKCLWQDHPLVR
jgi:hypothetical protein